MRLFFGLTLLLVGLLIVFGIFDASIFGTMMENLFFLWPFILIMVGISVLSNIKGLKWLKVVNIIFIVAFTVALIFYPTDYYPGATYEEYPFQIALSSPEVKTIMELKLGTVYLDIDTDYELTDVISGVYISDEDDLIIKQSDDRIKLEREDDTQFFVFKKPRHEIHLKIPANAYMELLIDSAVVKGDFDLKENPFEYVDINAAMIDLEVYLHHLQRPMKFKSEVAVNNLSFYLPVNSVFYNDVEAAINNFQIKSDSFVESEITPDLELSVRSAISNIALKPDKDE